jgi:hypothetical protein
VGDQLVGSKRQAGSKQSGHGALALLRPSAQGPEDKPPQHQCDEARLRPLRQDDHDGIDNVMASGTSVDPLLELEIHCWASLGRDD